MAILNFYRSSSNQMQRMAFYTVLTIKKEKQCYVTGSDNKDTRSTSLLYMYSFITHNVPTQRWYKCMWPCF